MKKIISISLTSLLAICNINNSNAFWLAKGDASLIPLSDGSYNLHCGLSNRICATSHASSPGQGDRIKVYLQTGFVDMMILSASYSSSENSNEGLVVNGLNAIVVPE